jgi:anti-anti-sigma regulatory factor
MLWKELINYEMISHDDCMCVIQMRCCLLKMEAHEEEQQKEIELKNKTSKKKILVDLLQLEFLELKL